VPQGLGDAPHGFVRIKDRGAVLSSDIRSLPVELGWVVGDGEEYLQDLPERDLARFERHLNRFRITSPPGADLVVVGLGLTPPAWPDTA
jgi:hypothetical protein